MVVDASVIAAWLFEDEQSDATEALLDQVDAAGAVAPNLWRYEAMNLVLMARARKRVEAADLDRLAAKLGRLPIQDDPDSGRRIFSATADLAVRHSLTAYDAAYLELAVRRRLPLATLDRALRRAAQAEAVALLP